MQAGVVLQIARRRNYSTEMCSGSDAGSYSRLITSQVKKRMQADVSHAAGAAEAKCKVALEQVR